MSGTPHGYTKKLAQMHQTKVDNKGRFVERKDYLDQVSIEIYRRMSQDESYSNIQYTRPDIYEQTAPPLQNDNPPAPGLYLKLHRKKKCKDDEIITPSN